MFLCKLYLVYFFLLEVWAIHNVVDKPHQQEGPAITGRKRRNIETITIETVVILDEDYISYLRSNGHSTNESLYELVALKWMGVQAEWGRVDVFGCDIRIAIKEIVLWERNPTWYVPSTVLDTTLYRICSKAKSRGLWKDYDYIHLFTGKKNTEGYSGKANTGEMCVNGEKCAVSAITRVVEYVVTAHELGHSMGMGHDGDVGCPSPNDGIMGSKTMGWSSCGVAAMKELLSKATAACVFRTDVPAGNKINLTEAWPGMVYTDDEICEFQHGSGYRYKTNSQKTCPFYTCVNMNQTSPWYGVSFSHNTPTDGSYCGDEMMCSSRYVGNKCMSWKETGLDISLFTKVKGNWSPWTSMTTCSRTCGTGVRYRQRTCNRPKPQNSAWCEGNEFDAELCNFEGCAGDNTSNSELIKQRAGETCTYWKTNNVFETIGENSTNYLNTGREYSNNNHGQCEVKCDKAGNYTGGGNKRHGIIPDGTPCTSNQLSSFVEKNNLPRKSGMFGRCVQGYCYLFGCDNKTGNTRRDGCGVCGGTNTTCNIVEGVYDIIVEKGQRGIIAVVPTNASLIQFHFVYGDMKSHFLELHTSDTNKGVVTFRALDTTKDPVKFAGTEWYLLWYKQYLYAQGPIDEEVVIKLYNYGGNNNTGVDFAYSIPLPIHVSTTTANVTSFSTTTMSSTKSSISTSIQTTEQMSSTTSTGITDTSTLSNVTYETSTTINNSTTTANVTSFSTTAMSSTKSSISTSIQTTEQINSTTATRITDASTKSNVTYQTSTTRMGTTESTTGKRVGIILGTITGALVFVLVVMLVMVIIYRRRGSSKTLYMTAKWQTKRTSEDLWH
ncbi:A disintegrin and metalloproteinase with thrombospondin motifs 18-like [Mercenaria mercenaria]|uniref:A disintegrin and metalloproteinase with thrombospondin motifs 18-like n=1 Tax=Mercenaria mercenaria TaxID=6596 RepID=UPI00234F7E57|nr:A disintegrin and metalloproteinase with thrombospondin motifs 18-like [Mercenaria mercenaria]